MRNTCVKKYANIKLRFIFLTHWVRRSMVCAAVCFCDSKTFQGMRRYDYRGSTQQGKPYCLRMLNVLTNKTYHPYLIICLLSLHIILIDLFNDHLTFSQNKNNLDAFCVTLRVSRTKSDNNINYYYVFV